MTHLSYKDCVELKEAGFPQEVKYGDWIYYPDKSCMFIGNSDDMGDTTGGYSPALGKESTTAKPNRIKVPTLSELIEACGEEFNNLAAPEKGHLYWQAWSKTQMLQVYGPTPEEAVKNLYIALHPKHHD